MSDAPHGAKLVARELDEAQLATMGRVFFDALMELRKQGVDKITALAAMQYATGALMANAGIVILDDPASIARAVEPLLHGWRTGSRVAHNEHEHKARAH